MSARPALSRRRIYPVTEQSGKTEPGGDGIAWRSTTAVRGKPKAKRCQRPWRAVAARLRRGCTSRQELRWAGTGS